MSESENDGYAPSPAELAAHAHGSSVEDSLRGFDEAMLGPRPEDQGHNNQPFGVEGPKVASAAAALAAMSPAERAEVYAELPADWTAEDEAEMAADHVQAPRVQYGTSTGERIEQPMSDAESYLDVEQALNPVVDREAHETSLTRDQMARENLAATDFCDQFGLDPYETPPDPATQRAIEGAAASDFCQKDES